MDEWGARKWRWRVDGVWLGQHYERSTNYVFDPPSKSVKEVREVQRVPKGERWSRELVESVCVWPRLQ